MEMEMVRTMEMEMEMVRTMEMEIRTDSLSKMHSAFSHQQDSFPSLRFSSPL
jgi:hypothetical protein